jgi:hypothetical protein
MPAQDGIQGCIYRDIGLGRDASARRAEPPSESLPAPHTIVSQGFDLSKVL